MPKSVAGRLKLPHKLFSGRRNSFVYLAWIPASLSRVSRSISKQIDPRDRDQWLWNVHRCTREGLPYSIDFRVLWRDGSIHWVSGQGEAVRDANGQIVRLIGIGTAIDITDRKATELRLAEAEAQARLLIEKNPALSIAFLRVTRKRKAMLALKSKTYWVRRQHSGTLALPIHGNNLCTLRSWKKCCDSLGDAIAEQRAYSFEYRMVRTDGQIIWVRDQGEILPQADGTLLIQGLAVDITALKETGLALAAPPRTQSAQPRNAALGAVQ